MEVVTGWTGLLSACESYARELTPTLLEEFPTLLEETETRSWGIAGLEAYFITGLVVQPNRLFILASSSSELPAVEIWPQGWYFKVLKSSFLFTINIF